MCNYLYYWVTVRNSQSYWHLEHMGETLACTQAGQGVARGGIGAIGWMGGQGRVTRQGWGKGLWGGEGGRWGGVCLCGRVRSGIFFDISRRYCIVFVYFLSFVVYFQKLLFHFFIFLGYEY